MRIYYFGELIEENGRKVEKQTRAEVEQISLAFEKTETQQKTSKVGMDSIGELLKDLNLNLDVYHPDFFKRHMAHGQ